MTQDERWELMYSRLKAYMEKKKRRPSKYVAEDHQMLEWLKYQKKRLARGAMPAGRQERFRQLLELDASVRRVNQYAYRTQTEELTLDFEK